MKQTVFPRKITPVSLKAATLLASTIFVAAVTSPQIAGAATDPTCCNPDTREVPMATSGNNLYMAWPNNDTGHWNVFFAKSTDGGKTLKTMMISAPNKGHTGDANTQIAASGSNVYVTWWTNKTGPVMPVFRASDDNGNTFGKTMILNSTR